MTLRYVLGSDCPPPPAPSFIACESRCSGLVLPTSIESVHIFTFQLIHTLISGYLSFYLTYYVVSLLSGFITAIFN